jgi:hypothetical protein
MNVVRDEVFQRLDLLEELLRRHLTLDRVAAQNVRCGLDRRAPRDLVRSLFCVLLGALVWRRLDRVEVDVRELAFLLLVVLDLRPRRP